MSMVRRSGRQFGARDVMRSVQLVNNYMRNRQRSQVPGKRSSGGSKKAIRDAFPLTAQHDYSSQYRKRGRRGGRRAARRRRRAKRFYRAVRKVDESLLGSRLHFHTQTGHVAWLAGQGTTWALMNCVLAQSGSRELTIKNIRDSMLSNNLSLRKTTRCYIQSVCLDVSITAPGTNTAPCDLDVYVIRCRKNVPQNALGSGVEVFATLQTALPNTNIGYIPVSDAGVAQARASTTMTTSTVGWTPWCAPNFCSFFTVLSKKKILLTPGGTTHLQLKKFIGRMITFEDLDRFDCAKGWTFGYFFQVNSVYDGVSQASGGLNFNFEQYYNVKQLRESEDTMVIV